MLRTTRQLPVEQVNASYRLPDDSELEQQIATEAAARDPERGLQLARDSLAKGLTYQLLELLDRLNQRDQEIAAKICRRHHRQTANEKSRARHLCIANCHRPGWLEQKADCS